MRRIAGAVVALAVAAGVLLPATPALAELPGTSNGGVRIMPLGDSITHGGATGGYRDDVAALIPGTAIDWVGSNTGSAPVVGDQDNEGHPGWTIDQLSEEVGHWLFAADPRTVLLQAGTNDILYDTVPATAGQRAADELAALIDKIVLFKPGVHVFVAHLPDLHTGHQAIVDDFNGRLSAIVAARTASNVHLVDPFDDLQYPADYFANDGVHPDASGYDKMAVNWADALLDHPQSLVPLPPGPAAPLGTTVSLKASNGMYVSAWHPDNHLLEPRSPHVADWERFAVVDAGGGWVALWSVGSQAYVSTVVTSQGAPLVANATQVGAVQMFRWVQVAPGKVVLVSAATSGFVFTKVESWGTFVYGHEKLAYASSVFEFQAAP